MTVEGSASILVLPETSFWHVGKMGHLNGTVGLLLRVVQGQEACLGTDAFRAEQYHCGGDVVLSDLNLSGNCGDIMLIPKYSDAARYRSS